MTNQTNHREPEDVVDRATAALRAQQVPEGPTDALLKQTIFRAGAGAISEVQAGRTWWKMRVVRRSAMAAGLILVAATGLLWLFHGGVAFADVVAQVKAAQAVRYQMEVEIETPGGGTQKVTTDALIVLPGWSIASSPSMKLVMNMERGKMLMLMPSTKQAMVTELKNLPGGKMPMVNLLDTFKNMDGKEGKPLGERIVDGKPTRGFEVNNANVAMKVWVDAQTELPVLVEATPLSPMTTAGSYVIRNFDWKPAYDPSELSLEVPEGYLATNSAMDASKASEQDVLTMLRAAADANHGALPKDLSLTTFSSILAGPMAARERAETAGMSADEKSKWMQKAIAEMTASLTPITRGWMFIGDTSQGENWQFAGAGVKLGEKGRGILWYQAKPSGEWRMIDADLTVHSANAADLPKGTPLKGMLATDTAPARTLPGN